MAQPEQDQAKGVAANQLISLLGIGAAGGAGARGLMGLRDMLMGSQIPTSPSYNLPHAIPVYGRPVHPAIAQEEEEQEPKLLPKMAFDLKQIPEQLSAAGKWVGDTAQDAGKWIGDTASKAPDMLAQALPKTHTLNPLMNEWGMPAGVAALGGGAVGGWGLMNWLLDKQKATTGRAELDSAEDEYHQALAQQYRAAMMAKQAGDDLGLNELADECLSMMDAIAEEPGMDKQAFTMSALGAIFPELDKFYSNGLGYDRWQAVKGGINTAGMLATLGTGKLTYDWAKGQNKQQLLAKALKRRQMARQQLSPPSIVALPQDEEP